MKNFILLAVKNFYLICFIFFGCGPSDIKSNEETLLTGGRSSSSFEKTGKGITSMVRGGFGVRVLEHKWKPGPMLDWSVLVENLDGSILFPKSVHDELVLHGFYAAKFSKEKSSSFLEATDNPLSNQQVLLGPVHDWIDLQEPFRFRDGRRVVLLLRGWPLETEAGMELYGELLLGEVALTSQYDRLLRGDAAKREVVSLVDELTFSLNKDEVVLLARAPLNVQAVSENELEDSSNELLIGIDSQRAGDLLLRHSEGIWEEFFLIDGGLPDAPVFGEAARRRNRSSSVP